VIDLHPNDRQLQQYLNRMCTELEYLTFRKHFKNCKSCRTRLHTYLELETILDQMPLLSAAPALEERIMQTIQQQSGRSESIEDAISGVRITTVSSAGRWRPELVNGLVAAAATFLFVTSGILGKLWTINPDSWGAGVQNQVAAIETVVTRISMQLIS
jgi:hypothetical protein